MTTDELIADVRNMELDHEPDGWPAVRMRDVSALADEIERLRMVGRLPKRWYCISRDGLAMLCLNERNAREMATQNDIDYPNQAPYIACVLDGCAP